MEVIYFFETSVDFQLTTWRYIPEDIASTMIFFALIFTSYDAQNITLGTTV
jgi:hypothetical protein